MLIDKILVFVKLQDIRWKAWKPTSVSSIFDHGNKNEVVMDNEFQLINMHKSQR